MYNVHMLLMQIENVVKYKFGTHYLKTLHKIAY